MNDSTVIIVGNTISALMSACRLADLGQHATLISPRPIINAITQIDLEPMNMAENADLAKELTQLTLKQGGYLGAQSFADEMWKQSFGLIDLLDKIGVPWKRSLEGRLIAHKQSGDQAFSYYAEGGTRTQIHRALVSQVYKYSDQSLIKLCEHHEPLSLIVDTDQRCHGIVFQDRVNMTIDAIPAEAVVVATNGYERLFTANEVSKYPDDFAWLIDQGIFLANAECLEPAHSLGGLWINEKQMTNIKGCFAIGACVGMYHGKASILGNAILADVFAGHSVAEPILDYVKEGHASSESSLYESCITDEVQKFDELLDLSGPEDLHVLVKEFAGILIDESLTALQELQMRFLHLAVLDKSNHCNHQVLWARNLKQRMSLAKLILNAKQARQYLHEEGVKGKMTKIRLADLEPEVFFNDVDMSLYQPDEKQEHQIKMVS
jgi:succinate dehydrogenase/fumarate reductase flavoprotein subunit